MPQRHVVIVGGGLAGLASAEAALEAGWRVTLVEASGRFGGVIETTRPDGWIVERSADSFLANRPEAIGLVERLGLADEIIGIQPAARRALVVRGGRLLPVPAGFRLMAPGRPWSLLASSVLSPAGRLRALAERWIPGRATDDDESLENFAVRRLGREAFERLVQPLVSGIWTADPARLSMAAACPEFIEMERTHGSLSRGERARLERATSGETAIGARYGQFVSLADGLGTLPARYLEAVVDRGCVLLEATVESIDRRRDGSGGHSRHRGGPDPSSDSQVRAGWRVCLATRSSPGPMEIDSDAVILAVPARVATLLVADCDPILSERLGTIAFAGSAIVSLGFRREQVGHPLDAAGLVVPRREKRRLLAASFSSSKFSGRAPDGHVLIRGFVGGALDPGAAALGDAELQRIVLSDLTALLEIRGEPVLSRVDRWDRAMPQYQLGHLLRLAAIEDRIVGLPGLAIAGCSYRGVGIPQVIRSGQDAFARLAGD